MKYIHRYRQALDIVGFVPDHSHKVNISIKQVTQMFWFPTAYKSYVYNIL